MLHCNMSLTERGKHMAKSKTIHNTAETMDSAFHTGAETIKSGFDKTAEGYDRMVAIAKDNAEAFMQAANVAGKGFETINGEILAFSRKRMEGGVEHVQAIFSAKSVNEAIELQADYGRKAFEAWMTQMNKVNQMILETTKNAAEPIQARVAAVAEMAQDAAA
jgi:phasin family protein